MNIARQIGILAGVPQHVPAYTVNMMCASGMQAVILAARTIQNGDASMMLCGGAESMSGAPYLLERARAGYKYGDGIVVDSVLRDGLVDAFSREHMGLLAERIATQYGIKREEQDAFAFNSHKRHAAAFTAGHFKDEIVNVHKLNTDEHARPDTTLDGLAALKPAFKPDGSVTAGNSSGINDGAAMLVICDETHGRRYGLKPMMIISRSAVVGCDPALMGMGPVHATRKVTNGNSETYDAIELNEAFAAQALACMRELGFDEAKVNTEGGAIALGHPIGASGARLLVHLAHRRPRRGLATLCVGGGMGYAVVLEQP
jgi:acetyl-CoA C-acetyltransferase